jgi:MarR family transcriptional regulator, organic hydroperoxide resistance regulator
MFDFVAVDQSEIILGLHQATHATLQALTGELAGLRLSGAELNVLAVLADGRARVVGELAAATATRPTTLTSVLDRLADKGHIARAATPADRRSYAISLTADGRRAAAAVDAAVRRLEERALADLSDADLAGFRAVLAGLLAAAR